jgi:hypothetical protein
MIIYGCFGALVDFIISIIKKLGGKKWIIILNHYRINI